MSHTRLLKRPQQSPSLGAQRNKGYSGDKFNSFHLLPSPSLSTFPLGQIHLEAARNQTTPKRLSIHPNLNNLYINMEPESLYLDIWPLDILHGWSSPAGHFSHPLRKAAGTDLPHKVFLHSSRHSRNHQHLFGERLQA